MNSPLSQSGRVVAAVYPGATVEQVEQEVLKPLEDYVFFKEVNKEKTHSRVTAGMVIIFVELDDNIDDTTPSGMNSRSGWTRSR